MVIVIKAPAITVRIVFDKSTLVNKIEGRKTFLQIIPEEVVVDEEVVIEEGETAPLEEEDYYKEW